MRTWWRIKAAPERAEPKTLRRLARGLDALRAAEAPGRRPEAIGDTIRAQIRMITCIAALETGAAPADVLAADFSRQRPLDPAWLAAARLRRVAVFLAVTELDFRRVDVAAALGISRQAVHQTIEALEGAVETEPAFAGLVAKVAELVTGQNWRV